MLLKEQYPDAMVNKFLPINFAYVKAGDETPSTADGIFEVVNLPDVKMIFVLETKTNAEVRTHAPVFPVFCQRASPLVAFFRARTKSIRRSTSSKATNRPSKQTNCTASTPSSRSWLPHS